MRNVVANKDFQSEGLHGCFSDAKIVSMSYNFFSDYILQYCFFSSRRIEILRLRHEERSDDDPMYSASVVSVQASSRAVSSKIIATTSFGSLLKGCRIANERILDRTNFSASAVEVIAVDALPVD